MLLKFDLHSCIKRPIVNVCIYISGLVKIQKFYVASRMQKKNIASFYNKRSSEVLFLFRASRKCECASCEQWKQLKLLSSTEFPRLGLRALPPFMFLFNVQSHTVERACCIWRHTSSTSSFRPTGCFPSIVRKGYFLIHTNTLNVEELNYRINKIVA